MLIHNYYFQSNLFYMMVHNEKYSLTCDRSNIVFIKPMYKITNFLALTPRYNFEYSHLINSRGSKCYAIFVFLLFFLGNMFSLSQRPKLYISNFKNTYKILDYLNDIILFIGISVMILNTCVFNRKQWLKLNKNFQKIDKCVNRLSKKQEKYFFNTFGVFYY